MEENPYKAPKEAAAPSARPMVHWRDVSWLGGVLSSPTSSLDIGSRLHLIEERDTCFALLQAASRQLRGRIFVESESVAASSGHGASRATDFPRSP